MLNPPTSCKMPHGKETLQLNVSKHLIYLKKEVFYVTFKSLNFKLLSNITKGVTWLSNNYVLPTLIAPSLEWVACASCKATKAVRQSQGRCRLVSASLICAVPSDLISYRLLL